METPPPLGETVCVRNATCVVRFVGPTSFSDGTWVGVEFPTAIGRNDGTVEGHQYFSCPPRHGVTYTPVPYVVEALDSFPPLR